MILFLEKLQINTEYKITVYQKKDTCKRNICYINIKISSMVAAPVTTKLFGFYFKKYTISLYATL